MVLGISRRAVVACCGELKGSGIVACPKCGSENVAAKTKGFDYGAWWPGRKDFKSVMLKGWECRDCGFVEDDVSNLRRGLEETRIEQPGKERPHD